MPHYAILFLQALHSPFNYVGIAFTIENKPVRHMAIYYMAAKKPQPVSQIVNIRTC